MVDGWFEDFAVQIRLLKFGGISWPTVLPIWPTSTFYVAAHLTGEPTGPPGKCQVAQSALASSLTGSLQRVSKYKLSSQHDIDYRLFIVVSTLLRYCTSMSHIHRLAS